MKQIASFRTGDIHIFAMSDEKEHFVLFPNDNIEGIKKESRNDLIKSFNYAVYCYLSHN